MKTRRDVLLSGSAVTLGLLGLRRFLFEEIAACSAGEDVRKAGYGELQADPNQVIDLPKGFRYSVIGRTGDVMTDGFPLPGAPDGMATFSGSRPEIAILIRNHELAPSSKQGPWGPKLEHLCNVENSKLYDRGDEKTPGSGGTTTVVFNTKTQSVERQFLSLTGTIRNCAGGPTPWGSWISCEETVARAGHVFDAKHVELYQCERDHGFNFEVPATEQPSLADPIPLKAMGRFNHEAVAVHPHTKIVYQTEDRDDGLFYRFVSKQPGRLIEGGTLQALILKGQPSTDTRNWKDAVVKVGEKLPVEWRTLDDVESPKDDLRKRGFESGAAKFARGEGAWTGHDGEIFFACTSGGPKKLGQIWRYVPSPDEGTPKEEKSSGTLELFLEPNNSDLLANCDNLTIAPWGDLFVCEDRGAKQARLIGVTPQGKLFTFAFGQVKAEMAGLCFSPDGTTLFVNAQNVGLTLAITGPWRDG